MHVIRQKTREMNNKHQNSRRLFKHRINKFNVECHLINKKEKKTFFIYF